MFLPHWSLFSSLENAKFSLALCSLTYHFLSQNLTHDPFSPYLLVANFYIHVKTQFICHFLQETFPDTCHQVRSPILLSDNPILFFYILYHKCDCTIIFLIEIFIIISLI